MAKTVGVPLVDDWRRCVRCRQEQPSGPADCIRCGATFYSGADLSASEWATLRGEMRDNRDIDYDSLSAIESASPGPATLDNQVGESATPGRITRP
jgi:hypothetical protein